MNTSTPPTIESILAQCLDAVLRGDLTVAECVQRYPNHADELRPLLLTALLTRRLKAAALPTTQVDALEQVLRAQMPRPTPQKSRIIAFSPVLARAAAAVVIVCLMLFGGGAGLVSASADALPGDVLYSVKRFWEEVRIVVASLMGGLEALSLELAEERLDEAQALAAMGKLNDAALRDLTTATERAARYNAGSPALEAFLNRARQTLTQIQPSPQAQTVYQQTLSVLEQVIQTQTAPTPTITPPLSSPTHTPDETQAVASPTLTPTREIAASPTPTFTATLRFPPTPTRTPTPTPSRTAVITATPPQGSPSPTWTDLPRYSTPFAPTTPAPVVGVTVIAATPEATTSQTLWVRQTQQSVYMTQTAQAPASPTP